MFDPTHKGTQIPFLTYWIGRNPSLTTHFGEMGTLIHSWREGKWYHLYGGKLGNLYQNYSDSVPNSGNYPVDITTYAYR